MLRLPITRPWRTSGSRATLLGERWIEANSGPCCLTLYGPSVGNGELVARRGEHQPGMLACVHAFFVEVAADLVLRIEQQQGDHVPTEYGRIGIVNLLVLLEHGVEAVEPV